MNLLTTCAEIDVLDDMVIFKLATDVTLFYGGMVDGRSFAQMTDEYGMTKTYYFPITMKLSDIIRHATDIGLPF